MVHEASVGEGDSSRGKIHHHADVQHFSPTTHGHQLHASMELGCDNEG